MKKVSLFESLSIAILYTIPLIIEMILYLIGLLSIDYYYQMFIGEFLWVFLVTHILKKKKVKE